MSDLDKMVLSALEDIHYSIELISKRFQGINSSDDFMVDEVGIDKLDSISMRLIAIGEGFKNIDKLTDNKLLSKFPQIDWRGVKGVRDMLSHHYFDVDAETIYEICDQHLAELLSVVQEMIELTKQES